MQLYGTGGYLGITIDLRLGHIISNITCSLKIKVQNVTENIDTPTKIEIDLSYLSVK